MSDDNTGEKQERSAGAARRERLAAELRDNLRKRKARKRASRREDAGDAKKPG